jgi:HEAT repeat protein
MQPPLFPLDESIASVELYPEVWKAAEAVILPDAESRRAGVARLLELRAARISALVVYLLATRLTEPDLSMRSRIVQALGEVLLPDEQGYPAPEDVRRSLRHTLSHMRTRQVYSLLQVLVHTPALEEHVMLLLDACPHAGSHLVAILADRTVLLAVREQAARMIGRVGYLDSLPALVKLAARLESRLNGQRAMPFVLPATADEATLLPTLQAAIDLLRH